MPHTPGSILFNLLTPVSCLSLFGVSVCSFVHSSASLALRISLSDRRQRASKGVQRRDLLLLLSPVRGRQRRQRSLGKAESWTRPLVSPPSFTSASSTVRPSDRLPGRARTSVLRPRLSGRLGGRDRPGLRPAAAGDDGSHNQQHVHRRRRLLRLLHIHCGRAGVKERGRRGDGAPGGFIRRSPEHGRRKSERGSERLSERPASTHHD